MTINNNQDGLAKLMQQVLPEGGVWIPEQKMHMEIMDEASANVWMTVDAVTQEQFDEFVLPENFRKVGRASGSMDQALFCHSPNGENQAVRKQTFDGLPFINVAQPAAPGPSASGLIEIMVNKAHILGFDAGRKLTMLEFDNQYFVEVVGSDKHDSELKLQNGAKLFQVELDQPWVVSLPNPTQTLWSFTPELRSFQGPIDLPKKQ